MKTTVITHQASLKLWVSRTSEQKASGIITVSATEAPDNTSCTTRTTCTINPTIHITLPDISLEIDKSVPTDILLNIIKAMHHA